MSGFFGLLFIITLAALVWRGIKIARTKMTVRKKSDQPAPRKRAGWVLGAVAGICFIMAGVTAPPQPAGTAKASDTVHTQQASNKKADQVTTKHETATEPVAFTSTTQNDASLAKGQTRVAQQGVNGVETLYYTVTYVNGVEKTRVLDRSVVTTPPVTAITAVGTYVAPAPAPQPVCANGSYVNSAGNRVCSPEVSNGAPAGATARCSDGTYSFSQSRRGTCSHHGGVASWL